MLTRRSAGGLRPGREVIRLRLMTGFIGLVALVLGGCAAPPPLRIDPLAGGCVPVTDPPMPFADQARAGLQQVLHCYVLDDGRVDYQALAADPQACCALDSYLAWASRANLDVGAAQALGTAAGTAFLLNTHLAATLRAVLAHYPLASLADYPLDFDEQVLFPVAGQWLCLAEMAELCRASGDERVLCALSRPVRSGPFPPRRLFTAETLDADLNERVQDYLGTGRGLVIDHEEQRVLLGPAVAEAATYYRWGYPQRFRRPYQPPPVDLATAVLPWADPDTQRRLANTPGYRTEPAEADLRLNDLSMSDSDP